MRFANAERGLRLAETDFVYLSEGAYGLIFVDRSTGLARKIYRRKADEEHVRNVFKAETDAYLYAYASNELAALVPGLFHICTPQRVVDKSGHDLSEEFFNDLVFETEFVEGHFIKIGSINSEQAGRIHALFRAAGIGYTADMSVCLTSEGSISKAIDFAVKEYEVWQSD